MQSRRTGRTLTRPVPITAAAKTRALRLPATRSSAPSRAGASLFGGGERQGYTQHFVKELIEKGLSGFDTRTKQVQDPYLELYNAGSQSILTATYMWPVQPMYPFQRLCELVITNNALGLCIEAYVTNIESYGWQLEYTGAEGKQDRPAVVSERARLESFLEFVSPDHTFRQVRENGRRDRETMGNCFYEVGRNLKGEVTMFDHIPAVTMRITRKDPTPVEVEIEVPDPEQPGRYRTHKVLRFFRRFVQITPTLKKVYFKELGDPRPINSKTGMVDETLPIEDQATEVMWLYNYTPGFLYGLPRWIGQLPSILGSRESEMVNLNFFRENAIPAMVVLVSGGALTQESYEKVRDYINAVRGQKSMNRVMVLEATVDDNMGGLDHSQPAPRIDIKPMISERQQEGLFQDYDQKNIQKVRSSFRLPPIFGGRAEDYTRASAYASMQVAESQIFQPERSFFDEIFQQKIIGSYRPKWHRFKTLAPHLVDAAAISQMVKSLGDQGALTPNIAIKLAQQVFSVHMEPILDEWGDYPFSILIEYVRAGAVLKGMEEFISDMTVGPEPVAPVAAAPTKPGIKPKPLPKKAPATKDLEHLKRAVKDEVLYEIRHALDTLEDAVLEAQQVA